MLIPREQRDEKAQLQGLPALTCGVPRWKTGVFSILERIMGRRGGGARAPRRPQFMLSHSRPLAEGGIPGWQGVAGWHNLTADPVDDRPSAPSVQSFLLLSPLLNVRSTGRVDGQAGAGRPRPPGLFSLPFAALTVTPLLPQPASCIYAVKPPLHMPQHETNTRCLRCESERTRCSPPAQGLI